MKIKPIFFVILVFIVAKLFFFTKFMVVLWDESVYLGIGKFFYSFGSVGLSEPIRPVVLSLFLGLGWKIGWDYILFGKFLSLFFSVAYIYLTYLVAKDLFNEKVGVFSSFILAITPIFFFNSVQIMTEIPSAVFGLVAILFFIRKKSAWFVGFFCALAFLTRFPQGLLLPCLFIAYFFVYKGRRLWFNLSKFVCSFLLMVFPFLFFNFVLYKNIFYPFISASSHGANPVHAVFDGSLLSFFHSIFYYLLEPLIDNFLFLFLFFGLFFVFKKKLYRNANIKFIFIFLMVFLSYFTFLVNKQLRFSLVFLPFFAILAGYGFFCLFNQVHVRRAYFRKLYVFVLFLFIVSCLFFVLVKDIKVYSWRVAEESPIQREFFKFFVDKDASCILTTDPVLVAYSDKLFIPYYDSIFVAEKVYGEFKDKCDFVVFTSEPFPCEFFGSECFNKKLEFFSLINSSRKLVFFNEYYGQSYYIFK